MGSVAVDPNDLSKGFYYVSDTEKPPKRTINDLLAIWICLQLYSGKTPKQLQNKLKIYSLKQIKDAPNRPYRKPGFYEDSGSSFMQWWTDFFNDKPSNDHSSALLRRDVAKHEQHSISDVRGAGELYLMRLQDLDNMRNNLLHEDYETKEDYLKDKELLDECISIMIDFS